MKIFLILAYTINLGVASNICWGIDFPRVYSAWDKKFESLVMVSISRWAKTGGGVNFGGFFFVQKNASHHLKSHEYGHSFQNMVLGFFMPFIVSIPSSLRYHYRKYKRKKRAFFTTL